MSAPVPASSGPSPITSGGQFLALVLRFVFGYGTLFACLLLLLRRPAWTLSMVDAAYWVALGSVVLLHRLSSRGADQIARWRTGTLQHLAISVTLWVLCQSIHVIP